MGKKIIIPFVVWIKSYQLQLTKFFLLNILQGNSMGDLSANVAMARKGMPDMATTGKPYHHLKKYLKKACLIIMQCVIF